MLHIDNRRQYLYIAPVNLSLKSYVEKALDLSRVQNEAKNVRRMQQQADVPSPTASPASQTSEDGLRVVKAASEIIIRHLRNSSLNAHEMVRIQDRLDAGIPDPTEYVISHFPATFLVMLAGCSGKEYIMRLAEERELPPAVPT